MANSEPQITEFTALVRQLLNKYVELKQELADVKVKIAVHEKEAKEMETLATASMYDYDMLKTAKMLEVSDGDIVTARKRINKLIRDVDRCITLLSEQNNTEL